ncbi:type I restriction enzyme S subunit [Mesonia hippocampi]|uniref:Type I restriction enzyme S subunit n=1 Tax=Mesonia hippocampi TaxID=1628250 RepID=A0A840EXD3_9FLAO|nr:type I restriction enzyme S subunit [Mesonia hippocampi]
MFNNIYSFKKTNSYSRENLNYEKGEIKNIHYGDIHTKFNSLFDIDIEIVPFINKEIDTKSIDEDNYLKVGDLVIADASEDYNDIGKTIEIKNLNKEKLVAGLHTFLARKESKEIVNGFASFLMKTYEVRIQIMKIAQGTKVLGISKGRLEKIKLTFPEIEEQHKLVDFLTLIDARIQTSNKIVEDLKSLSKGLQQKIFSQQLRFKDDNGNDFSEWEFKNGNLLFKNISDKEHNSDLPILAITQDKGAIPRDLIDYNIGVTAKSVSAYKVVQEGDFIISLRSFQGGIEYSNYKGICSPAYIILRPIKNMNRVFYKYYLKTAAYIIELNRKLEGIRDGKMISYKYFSEIKLPYPSLEEQTKIANFLSSLDAKLDKEKQLLEQYQQQKKFLLQNLFI